MTTEQKIDVIYEKLFEGNGEPSIISRLTKLETCMSAVVWFSGLTITSVAGLFITFMVKQ